MKYIILFLKAFDVVFGFAKAKDKLENVWQKDETKSIAKTMAENFGGTIGVDNTSPDSCS